ncbi:MAG: type II toxin-antitoxin system RelE/ParE family toxin [Acidobacteriota bacterium]
MARYRLLIKPSAAKELENISKRDRTQLVRRIEKHADEPRCMQSEKLSGRDRYRVRQGRCRILYSIDDEQIIVVVVKIGHRNDVYR